MIAKKIANHIYAVPLGFVNIFLVDAGELVLIDTGIPGSEQKIFQAFRELGKQPSDLRHILITHLHFDHTGSLAAVKQASGAQVWMHEKDAQSYLRGDVMRPVQPGPGLFSALIVKTMRSNRRRMADTPLASVDHMLNGGEEIPSTAGLKVLHTPGHTAGHLAFLWPDDGGVLFAGDLASNMFNLSYSILYEDLAQGKATLAMLGQTAFDKACFSHGGSIQTGASQKFRTKFAA
jgi:glyoxylase-like metal-dependent hydrolase (beta-lactamase superfamily II)